MAASEPNSVSPFPAPPMNYVSKYSDDNVRLGRAPKPPPPTKDSYMMFGTEYKADDHIVRPLESQSLLRLHPHNYDHKRELKKLNFSILVNFLDLLDVLVKAPSHRRRIEKIDDLTLLFIHMHHLINEFRPHQARETLRVMLEKQKQQRLEQAEKIEKCNEQVRGLLNATVSSLPDDSQLQSKLLVSKNFPVQSENQPFEMKSFHFSNASHSSLLTSEVPTVKVKQEVLEDMEVDKDIRDEMMCNIVDALN